MEGPIEWLRGDRWAYHHEPIRDTSRGLLEVEDLQGLRTFVSWWGKSRVNF